jgi:hypothetical protein
MIKYKILEDKSIEFRIYDDDHPDPVPESFIINAEQLLDLQGKIRDACFDWVKATGLRLDAKTICEERNKDGSCK